MITVEEAKGTETSLEDPCDTGALWAMAGPLSVALASTSRGQITLAPEFAREALSVQGRGRFTVVPAQILGIALWFLAAMALMSRRS